MYVQKNGKIYHCISKALNTTIKELLYSVKSSGKSPNPNVSIMKWDNWDWGRGQKLLIDHVMILEHRNNYMIMNIYCMT